MSMNEVIVVQNDMSREGLRCLHIMASEPVDQAQLRRWTQTDQPLGLDVKLSEDELRLHHLSATWLAREAMYYIFDLEGTGKKHPVVVYASATHVAEAAEGGSTPPLHGRLDPGIQIKEDAIEAALMFYGTFGYWPSAAWVRTWPKGLQVEDAFVALGEGFGLDLFAVPWAMDGFVIVGGGWNQER
jgi:hypothetical protein